MTAHIRQAHDQVLGQFALHRQVILFGVLGSRILRCLAEQENRAEAFPILGLPARGIENAVEGVRKSSDAILTEEGKIELGIENEGASTEGWLGAELFQHELFDGVVENAVARANAGLSGTAENLAEQSVLGRRAPSKSNAWRERFVVGVGKTAGNPGIARDH